MLFYFTAVTKNYIKTVLSVFLVVSKKDQRPTYFSGFKKILCIKYFHIDKIIKEV